MSLTFINMNTWRLRPHIDVTVTPLLWSSKHARLPVKIIHLHHLLFPSTSKVRECASVRVTDEMVVRIPVVLDAFFHVRDEPSVLVVRAVRPAANRFLATETAFRINQPLEAVDEVRPRLPLGLLLSERVNTEHSGSPELTLAIETDGSLPPDDPVSVTTLLADRVFKTLDYIGYIKSARRVNHFSDEPWAAFYYRRLLSGVKPVNWVHTFSARYEPTPSKLLSESVRHDAFAEIRSGHSVGEGGCYVPILSSWPSDWWGQYFFRPTFKFFPDSILLLELLS